MYFLYSLMMAIAALVLTPYWIFKGITQGKYLSNLSERLGFSFPGLDKLPKERAGAIWLHAVSVGEALSSVALAKKLKERYPERPLVVSTTTITGQAIARERMPFADALIYFPLDWAFCVKRAMAAVKPAIVIVLETEIWPNFLREAGRSGVPVVFVSGRISDRSFARYQKWFGAVGFYLRPLMKSALGFAAAFLMQGEKDAERIRALGAPAEKVFTSGNVKYDQELPQATPLSEWLEREVSENKRRPLIVAGSVVANEEPLALIAFGVLQGEHRDALLVLAPRKPERFGDAEQYIEDSHQKFIKRSQLGVASPPGALANGEFSKLPAGIAVILLDSIGELASLYRIADGVFVGGSLVESGGHNILEPAAFAKVPVFGPSMENFAEMSRRFLAGDAAIQVESPEDAGVTWIELLRQPERMQRMGDNAKRLVEESRGATDRALAEIEKHLAKRLLD
ncbi:MAG: 3-deoxy-D-manno-octulosonic acid transferase [Acidobacteria bacterium]|nr:3-deoxy-D-manno-octulosonic acid transferase [Acidobacteriota bacterium]